jgi:hypothetical protein
MKTQTAKQFIIDNYGENWLISDWNPGDVMDAIEEYHAKFPLREPITQPMLSDEIIEIIHNSGDLYNWSDCLDGDITRRDVNRIIDFFVNRVKDKLQSLPVVPSEITEQKILEKIQECVYYSDGDWSVKNSLRELAKEIYSLFKQSLPREDKQKNETAKCKGCGTPLDTNYCSHCNELWQS